MNCDTNDWDYSSWLLTLPLYRFSDFMFNLGWDIDTAGAGLRGKPIVGPIGDWMRDIRVWLWDKRFVVRDANADLAMSYCRATQWFQGWRLRDLLSDFAGHVRALIDDPSRWLRERVCDIFQLPHVAYLSWDMCVFEFLDIYFPVILAIKRDPINWVYWQLRGVATWLDGLLGDTDEYIWTMLQAGAGWIKQFRNDPWGFVKSLAKQYKYSVWELLDHPIDFILALIASLFGLPPEFNADPLSYLLGAFIHLLDDNKATLERVIGYWGERFVRWLWERR